MANIRSDTREVLGVVTQDYKVVQNVEAFEFLDEVLNSDLYFETAGSIHRGKRVWVLARVPEYIEVGGDQHGIYLYVANSHDGTMSVTAAVTPVRIVCANTLGFALSRSDGSDRTFKFRHTGDLDQKFAEARQVMNLTINYSKQFKTIGDKLALSRMNSVDFLYLLNRVFPRPKDPTKRVIANREKKFELISNIFTGNGPMGDTTGNIGGTRLMGLNAISEYLDWNRRYLPSSDQMKRSFEDTAVKQRAFELVAWDPGD